MLPTSLKKLSTAMNPNTWKSSTELKSGPSTETLVSGKQPFYMQSQNPRTGQFSVQQSSLSTLPITNTSMSTSNQWDMMWGEGTSKKCPNISSLAWDGLSNMTQLDMLNGTGNSLYSASSIPQKGRTWIITRKLSRFEFNQNGLRITKQELSEDLKLSIIKIRSDNVEEWESDDILLIEPHLESILSYNEEYLHLYDLMMGLKQLILLTVVDSFPLSNRVQVVIKVRLITLEALASDVPFVLEHQATKHITLTIP